ncbi:hypothetical protein DPMN_069958 [Dreissena polymorpha]|uniref:Uncharacterized protein n=1 Tax=Dreissena polymorpha TaxID=45954 RepID=A0A9D3Z5B0_DREPO|nr:hypothetical protein DPMN_069958 [Dreissena polymorpha]
MVIIESHSAALNSYPLIPNNYHTNKVLDSPHFSVTKPNIPPINSTSYLSWGEIFLHCKYRPLCTCLSFPLDLCEASGNSNQAVKRFLQIKLQFQRLSN